MSVIPLWASHGGAGSSGVGATTGVMLAATVVTQLNMVWLFRLLSLRQMLAVGALVLAVATPAYVLTDALAPLVAISAVRGIGFAFVVVAGVALAAELAPAGKVATAAGWYGVAAGLPNVFLMPAGVWLAQTWGFAPVFLCAAGMALLAVPLLLSLPEHGRQARRTGPRGWVDRRAFTAAGVFLVTAATLGTVATFLPVALPESPMPSIALFVLSVVMVATRLGAGALADRHGPGRLVAPSAIVCAVGAAGMAATVSDGGPALLVAAAVFGAGFGAAQNDSFVVVLRHLGPGRSGTASTIWNIAYDGGMGVGPFAVGLALTLTGYPGAFLALAVALALAAAVGYAVGGPRMGMGVRETPQL
ncbi:MFS transporter [Georgenia halophila]|uniref:MFS transporter n=2 Tax=Georgenia halophila TaxID=620889 RepID=A0ABP8LJD5_9MICO